MIRNHDDQVGFMPGMQGFLNIKKPVNVITILTKKKAIYDHLNRYRKRYRNKHKPISIPDLKKTLHNLEIIGNFLNLIKGIFEKCSTHITM